MIDRSNIIEIGIGSAGGVNSSVELRIEHLEGIIYEVEIFELIESGTTGSITKPTDSTIILDQYEDAGDCLIFQVDTTGTKPINKVAVDSSGIAIASTLDIAGAYTFSGTPDAYPVALIYQIQIKGIDLGNITLNNVIDQSEINTADRVTYGNTNMDALNVKEGIDELKNITTITKDPTGFFEPENLVINYDSTARTVTITTMTEAYFKGKLVPELVSGWTSTAHDVASGAYFLYYDGTSFVWSNTPWTFDLLQIAYTYVDGVNFGLRECHGLMPYTTHLELHKTIGTYLDAGGDLSGYTLDSTTLKNPVVSACTIYDEDIKTVNATNNSSVYTQFYNAGAGATSTFQIDQTAIVPVLVNQPYYNQFTGGAWQQTLLPVSNYMALWQIAIPTTSDAESQKFRFIWVQGQTAGTLSQIQALSPSNVNLGDLSLLSPEFVFINKVIIRYIGGNWSITSAEKITGTKTSQSLLTGAFLSSVAVDTTLTGNGTAVSPLSVAVAQPNITSLGTLTGLTVAGNIIQSAGVTSLKATTITGALGLTEQLTTPTAVANEGKIYTKADNNLYFQDGAGTEHEIAYV
ncbi:MAG: hypothetical protein PF569_08180 [Candidatus Woesearchaeota archaeon]|jgi:hypothetical protein|nr:hypothetical protein [Candidatus Woesearchaeota archaeon]